ncbi:hypothetical protein EJ02DRAFT_452312 [Clathrospora elynae]|uniref:Uncharacterized protein n=1 Tax=Clathrospora elynae TaxID=706981 RepID=A0A6A5SX77_9PLEO|nr:hypothetical protein EJ02DRAFT_452312 [Clathrospora elynae]
MHFSMLITGSLAAVTPVLASPIQPTEPLLEVGHVTLRNGTVYPLQETGIPDIRVITFDKENDYFVRPITYHVEENYVCKFFEESSRGVGPVIGEWKGPADGEFGDNWAAFYMCWHIAKSANIVFATTSPIAASAQSRAPFRL